MTTPTRAMVEAKARAVFPDRDVPEIMAALDAYGMESHERERERVQLAILKLCDEEGLADPSRYVQAAKSDYRDVLAWAEYPNQIKADPIAKSTAENQRQLIEKDLQQYEVWLNKPYPGPDKDSPHADAATRIGNVPQ